MFMANVFLTFEESFFFRMPKSIKLLLLFKLRRQPMHPTLIIRHKKENKKKCTLQPLLKNKNFLFHNYPSLVKLPDLSSYIVLAIEGDTVLSEKDQESGLILLDGTWKYAAQMYQKIFGGLPIPKRTLPGHYLTAYPRKQTGCLDPERGLASIEALYIAYHQLGWNTDGLLDYYYFKDEFLRKNKFI